MLSALRCGSHFRSGLPPARKDPAQAVSRPLDISGRAGGTKPHSLVLRLSKANHTWRVGVVITEDYPDRKSADHPCHSDDIALMPTSTAVMILASSILQKGFSLNSVHAARFLRFAFSAALGLVAFRAAADSPPRQAPLELTAENLASVIDPLMAEWIDKRKGPGAVVVVVKRDGPVFAKGYGFADVEAREPFTADAILVRPGSISKLFTGIAVMQLVDAGKLDLDRDV